MYAALGVREYWLFDPNGVRRDGGALLEGWRLDPDGVWQPVPRSPAAGGLVSEVLDLELVVAAGELRLRDRQSGDLLPDLTEATRLLEHEAERADREAARLEAARKRIAELEELISRGRAS